MYLCRLQGNVRLVGGAHRCAGRIEFYKNGQWGTICGEYWDMNDATVVCRQLNCGKVHKIDTTNKYSTRTSTGPHWPENIACNGLESTLGQCGQQVIRGRNCNATSFAAVVCTGKKISEIICVTQS